MPILQDHNQLVTYVVPDQKLHKQMELEASGFWRVFDGAKWKFHCETREQALAYCKQLKGTHIGCSVWNEEYGANVYQNVEVV